MRCPLMAGKSPRPTRSARPGMSISRRLFPRSPPVFAIMESFSKSARREVRRAGRQNIAVRPVLDDAAALEFLDSPHRRRKARRIGAIARPHALGNLRIAPLLWLKCMEWAQSKGCTALVVEGWRENVDPTEKKCNLYRYKSEFSPRAIRRISERSKVANRLVDMTGNLKNDLRTMVRDLLRGLLPRLA